MENAVSGMAGLLLALRLILASIFGIASFGKLLSPVYAGVGMSQHGLAERWSIPFVLVVSFVELVIAIGLLITAYSWIASILASLMLLCSISIVAANLGRGVVKRDCRCFGRVIGLPMNVSLVVYHSLLAAMAIFLALQGPSDPGPGVSDSWVVITNTQQIGLAFVATVIALFALRKGLRAADSSTFGVRAAQDSPASSRNNPGNSSTSWIVAAGPAVGSHAPTLQLLDERGMQHTLATMCAGEQPKLLLVFVDLGDDRYRTLVGEVGLWQRQYAQSANTWLVVVGSSGDLALERRRHGLTQIARSSDPLIVETYALDALPSAVLIDRNAVVVSRLAVGPNAVRALAVEAMPTNDAAAATKNRVPSGQGRSVNPGPCLSCGH